MGKFKIGDLVKLQDADRDRDIGIITAINPRPEHVVSHGRSNVVQVFWAKLNESDWEYDFFLTKLDDKDWMSEARNSMTDKLQYKEAHKLLEGEADDFAKKVEVNALLLLMRRFGRDVFFDLTYQILQLRMEINRSEAIGSFSESPTDFDAGAGVSEPRFWYKIMDLTRKEISNPKINITNRSGIVFYV